MRFIWPILIVTGIYFLGLTHCEADETDIDELISKTYSQYQAHIKDKTLKYVFTADLEKAFHNNGQTFESQLSTARFLTLKAHYATKEKRNKNLGIDSKPVSGKANKFIKQAKHIYEDMYRKPNMMLVQAYMELAHSRLVIKARNGDTLMHTAVKIASKLKGKYNFEVGLLKLDAARQLFEKNKLIRARRLLLQAEQNLIKNGSSLDMLAQVSFWKAHYAKRLGDNNKAIKLYYETLERLGTKDKNIKLFRKTHLDLATIFEKKNNSKEASRHNIAITKSYEGVKNQEIKLVYAIKAKTPYQAKRQTFGGTLEIKFLVDKNGFVHNPKYISGKKIFLDSAKNAIKKFRYAPKIINGETVAVNDMTYTFEYINIGKAVFYYRKSPQPANIGF